MNLQPSEFIALTTYNPQPTYNTAPGTVVRLRNHIFSLCLSLYSKARTRADNTVNLFAARMRADKENNND